MKSDSEERGMKERADVSSLRPRNLRLQLAASDIGPAAEVGGAVWGRVKPSGRKLPLWMTQCTPCTRPLHCSETVQIEKPQIMGWVGGEELTL